MTNPNRPGPPHAAPRGHRWVPDMAEQAEPIDPDGRGDKKCQRQSGSLYKTNPCNAIGVARVDGKPLCGYHLGHVGMWVDAGIVFRWQLEPLDEEE
jgi:hypothetical protein